MSDEEAGPGTEATPRLVRCEAKPSRRRAFASVLAHHAGKQGQQRGTSGREDSLDTVIHLARPAGYDPREGCRFELSFSKCRSVKGEAVRPLDVRLVEGQWQWMALELSKLDQARRLLTDGITGPSDLSEELGITRGYASKLLTRVTERSLVMVSLRFPHTFPGNRFFGLQQLTTAGNHGQTVLACGFLGWFLKIPGRFPYRKQETSGGVPSQFPRGLPKWDCPWS